LALGLRCTVHPGFRWSISVVVATVVFILLAIAAASGVTIEDLPLIYPDISAYMVSSHNSAIHGVFAGQLSIRDFKPLNPGQ
jgi:hypothetical protein